jgi:predicted HicB family RNase H-like nuclease
MTAKPRPGRPPRAKRAASARFELRLTGDELRRWSALAERQGISLAELVRESVEAAIARGSSR